MQRVAKGNAVHRQGHIFRQVQAGLREGRLVGLQAKSRTRGKLLASKATASPCSFTTSTQYLSANTRCSARSEASLGTSRTERTGQPAAPRPRWVVAASEGLSPGPR